MLTRKTPKRFYKLCKIFTKSKHLRSFSSATENESRTPNYPQILDTSSSEVKKREKLALHEKYRKLNTIEEKLLALNFPRYWGWEAVILKEGEIPYNALPFYKYMTRTHFKEISTLPVNKCTTEIDPKDLVSVIKPQIQEAILFESFERKYNFEDEEKINNDVYDDIRVKDIKLKSILNEINRILIINLAQYVPHIIETEVDYNPRLEAFWSVGGFKRSEEEHRIRTETLERDDIPFDWKNEDGNEIEHWFQYFGNAILQLRTSLPLEPLENNVNVPFVELDDIIAPEKRVSPEFHGFDRKRRFGTTIPGFWPGKGVNEFGLLSYHSSNHLLGRPPHFEEDELSDAIHAQAVLAGYAWLHGQASYQGFSTFNEIAYPLVSQHVITDGQFFSFYLYQLNTLLMHKEFYNDNRRCNLCLGTQRMKLYDEINGREFIGWNDEVVSLLISMYMNKIAERSYDMKPNVDKQETYLADIKDIDERRAWLHREFHYMYSNRPRPQLAYEIFDWEWIYKVKFMMRSMERRSRPFECWKHPLTERSYKDYLPTYIPKHLRDPKNPRQKYYKTYFPDAF